VDIDRKNRQRQTYDQEAYKDDPHQGQQFHRDRRIRRLCFKMGEARAHASFGYFLSLGEFGHVRKAISRPPESGIWENAPPNAARGEEIYKLAL
jgi:hypothetical protein